MSGLVAATPRLPGELPGRPPAAAPRRRRTGSRTRRGPVSATASRISSSLQPASRASSTRWWGGRSVGSSVSRISVEQRRLLLVRGGEVAGPGDLVEAEPGDARRPGVLGQCVGVVAPLGDGEADPLAGRPRQLARAKLGAQARVAAQGGGGLGEDAEELGDGAAGRLDALDQGSAAVRCGQLVVDVEAADVCLDCHFSRYRRFTRALLYF